MDQTLSVAVIGTGSIGMRHLDALRRLSGVRPVAVPHRQERVHELERAGYAAAENLNDAVHKWGVTLCVVASDTGRHQKDSLSAIRYGLDALVEKPLCADVQQARQLCRSKEQANRKLFVGCVFRFSESLNTFRAWLGRIGKPHAARIECQSFLPDWRPARAYRDSYSARAEEGGVLRDLIHEIDYAGWLFGWPAALQARVRNTGRLGIAADEAADLMWETAEGCAVSVRLDYLSRPARRQMRAYGERGTLEWDGVLNTVRFLSDGEPAQELISAQTRDDMMVAQARAFISAARGSIDASLATEADGVKALAVCDAARRATNSMREEPVEY